MNAALSPRFYQAAQYISLGIITPLMTIILHNLSWHFVFYYIGAIGVILGVFWLIKIKDPMHHPKVNSTGNRLYSRGRW